MVQSEDIEILTTVFGLMEIIQEHLAHVVDGYSAVNRAVQSQGTYRGDKKIEIFRSENFGRIDSHRKDMVSLIVRSGSI